MGTKQTRAAPGPRAAGFHAELVTGKVALHVTPVPDEAELSHRVNRDPKGEDAGELGAGAAPHRFCYDPFRDLAGNKVAVTPPVSGTVAADG